MFLHLIHRPWFHRTFPTPFALMYIDYTNRESCPHIGCLDLDTCEQPLLLQAILVRQRLECLEIAKIPILPYHQLRLIQDLLAYDSLSMMLQ